MIQCRKCHQGPRVFSDAHGASFIHDTMLVELQSDIATHPIILNNTKDTVTKTNFIYKTTNFCLTVDFSFTKINEEKYDTEFTIRELLNTKYNLVLMPYGREMITNIAKHFFNTLILE